MADWGEKQAGEKLLGMRGKTLQVERKKAKTLVKRQELCFFFKQMIRDGRDGRRSLTQRVKGQDDEQGRRPSGDQNTSET